jgi:hypothetical protein
VQSAAALSVASAATREIEGFDEVMREAGLLLSSPADDTEAKQEAEISVGLSELAVVDAGVPVADAIE